MPSYRGTADQPDKAKAITAVVVVHAVLAVVIVTGLNVSMVSRAVEDLKVFDIRETPPPPPPPTPPKPKPVPKPAMQKPQGAPAPQATQVVAPPPKIPEPTPIPAAKIAGTGSASTSGAATAGTGSGAGGLGNGPGGGGDYSKFTPARRISKIPDDEYAALADTGLRSGSVGVTVRVNPDGTVSDCRIARTSGNAYADNLMCNLTLRYIRFAPARDATGRAIWQDVTFYPNWWRP